MRNLHIAKLALVATAGRTCHLDRHVRRQEYNTIPASAGGPIGWGSLLWSISLAYVLLVGRLFARIYRRAVRTGLIARYSVETPS